MDPDRRGGAGIRHSLACNFCTSTPLGIELPGLMYAHRAFELTTFRFGEVHHFGQPITITPHYRDTVVIGLKRETLRL